MRLIKWQWLTEYFKPVIRDVLLVLPGFSKAEENSNHRNVRDIVQAISAVKFTKKMRINCQSKLTWCQIHFGCWQPEAAMTSSLGICSRSMTGSIHDKAEILPFHARVQRWKSVQTWWSTIWLQFLCRLLKNCSEVHLINWLRYLLRHGTCWRVQTFGGSLATVTVGSWNGTQSHKAFTLRMRQLRMHSERVYFLYSGCSSENRHWRFSAL